MSHTVMADNCPACKQYELTWFNVESVQINFQALAQEE